AQRGSQRPTESSVPRPERRRVRDSCTLVRLPENVREPSSKITRPTVHHKTRIATLVRHPIICSCLSSCPVPVVRLPSAGGWHRNPDRGHKTSSNPGFS